MKMERTTVLVYNIAAEDMHVGSTYREVSCQTPFRFLDLPAELREMVYSYYYASNEPVLNYSYQSSPDVTQEGSKGLETNASKTSHPRKLKAWMSGLSGSSLHQVCRLLAVEATPFWLATLRNLTINVNKYERAIFRFWIMPKYYHLKRQLVNLKIVDTVPFQSRVPWKEMVASCPNLRHVEVTCPSTTLLKGLYELPQSDKDDYAEAIVYEEMNWGFDEISKNLRDYLLPDLVKAFEEHGRRRYSVTATFRERQYDMESNEGCVGCNMCNDPETQGFDDEFAHRKYALVHKCTFVIKYGPGYAGKMLSKCCDTAEGFRGRWDKGMDRPMVTRKGSERWEEMVFNDAVGLWFFP